MNKKLLILLLGVLLISCTEEEKRLEKNEKYHCISAKIENYQNNTTRVLNNEYKLSWETNDRIGVFTTNTTNAVFNYQDTQGNIAEFEGILNSSEETIDFAYYPYQTNAERIKNDLSIVLPSEYNFTGNYSMPMIGIKDNDSQFIFKHLCGALRVIGNNLFNNIDRIVITSIGDVAPAIAGKAIVKEIATNNIILTIDQNGSKSITYHIQNSDRINTEDIIIPLPVGTYLELQISLYNANSSEPTLIQTLSNVAIKRAILQDVNINNTSTESSDYKLNNNVQLISEGMKFEVTLSTHNNSELIFNNANKSELPAIGKIILAKSSEILPTGFLGRVTDIIENSNNSFTIKTEKVSLSEAFDKLYVNETVNLIPEEADNISTKGLLNSIFFDGELSNTFNWNYPLIGENSFSSKGYLNTGIRLTININLDKDKKMEYCAITVISNMKLHTNLGIQIATKEEIELGRFTLMKINFLPVRLLGGIITINPTLEPQLYVTGEGYMKYNNIEVDAEVQSTAAALFKNGQWEKGTCSQIKVNNESPWNFQNNIELDGTLRVGIANEINYKLYNVDEMRLFITPEVGTKLNGNISLDNMNLDSSILEEILDKTTFTTSLYLRGKVGADASLLIPVDTLSVSVPIPIIEYEFEEFDFCKKEIRLIPFFKELTANVSTQDNSTLNYAANINTEITGELLTKDVEIGLALTDPNGQLISDSNPIIYNGGTTNKENTNTSIKMEEDFENLNAESTYMVYPKITSPAFSSLQENGTIELKGKAIEFKTSNQLRDVLTKIYHENGGDSWTNKKNWCTDAPVAEWEGVDLLADGTYKLSFISNNELTGTLSIENCYVPIILCSSNTIEKLHIKNCPNLKFDNPINNFSNLRDVYIENIKLVDEDMTGIEIEDQKKYTFKFKYMDKLENIEIRNCKNELYYMEIFGCPSLTSIVCEMLEFDEKKYKDLFYDTDYTLEYGETTLINISDCAKLETIQFNNNMCIGSIYLQSCHSLTDASFEQNDPHIMHIRNCKIKNFSADKAAISIDDSQTSVIDNVNILHGSLCLHDTNDKNRAKISVLNLKGSLRPYYHNTIKFNNSLKFASISKCDAANIDFNGCNQLETIICSCDSSIDVRNTPALKQFICKNATDVYFDSHLGSVYFDCTESRITKIIPSFLNPESGLFRYIPRYKYEEIKGQYNQTIRIEVIDRGYGWWFPGEPERGYH